MSKGDQKVAEQSSGQYDPGVQEYLAAREHHGEQAAARALSLMPYLGHVREDSLAAFGVAVATAIGGYGVNLVINIPKNPPAEPTEVSFSSHRLRPQIGCSSH